MSAEELRAGPAAVEIGARVPPPAVEMWAVHKSLGRRPVLRGVNLQVHAGRTLAIVGPNGAGKTTLLRVLATRVRPSSGAVRICGVDAVADPVAARRHLGVVGAATFLYEELSGAENLRHYARLYGVEQAESRLIDLAGLVGLDRRLDERVGTYSRGMAQRLSLARALLHRPDVLLLDEPDVALDPGMTAELARLFRADGAPERAVVLTGHDLRLTLSLADDVAVLTEGRFVFAGPSNALTLEQLRHVYDGACRTGVTRVWTAT